MKKNKPTPPSKKHLKKRRDFFRAHIDLPNARWEVFNCTNLLIHREYVNGNIDRQQYIKQLKDLDKTQGLVEPPTEMEKLNERMFH